MDTLRMGTDDINIYRMSAFFYVHRYITAHMSETVLQNSTATPAQQRRIQKVLKAACCMHTCQGLWEITEIAKIKTNIACEAAYCIK